MYRRVVITGVGVVGPLGCTKEEVTTSMREGKPGIVYCPEYKERGFRSNVIGEIKRGYQEGLSLKVHKWMGEQAGWAYQATESAILDAGLPDEIRSHAMTGLLIGAGGPSTEDVVDAVNAALEKGPKRAGTRWVPKTMASSCSATVGTSLGIRGASFSISSACATSAHNIGEAWWMIRTGRQDCMLAGGAEGLHWTQSVMFDAMPALSSLNDSPETASRPFDKDRTGFVISGGGAVVVLETLEAAQARGAPIYGEIVGYGATSDGHHMTEPSGEGAVRAMRMAMEDIDPKEVDLISPHATSTPVGDRKEAEAIMEVFGTDGPWVTASKSLTGHMMGAAGAAELIMALLMIKERFIHQSMNIQEVDPACAGLKLAYERVTDIDIRYMVSNSFGFGGTNACLCVKRLQD
ncbi:MAG: beta-ketoacyl-ACP synthase I [Candidatus Thiosymbion ectosymbiont of Robbea hypermnestra]|nr:beta-ketoacyl-ACP synthase I [Candidatus Thiosymbion ectosymbiont of Robbea hypermnestra]